MPDIRPFRGLRYNPGKVNIADVVAPPYDVISPEHQNELYDRSPFNVVRLILGRAADRYQEAARNLAAWGDQQILLRDVRPALYLLEQEFRDGHGSVRKRLGFIAACRVEDFSTGTVLPHERTLSKPKEDRFRLLQATNTNFSQIFSLYADPGQEMEIMLLRLSAREPMMTVEFENVKNRLWMVIDPEAMESLGNLMRMKTVLIADGHHRYETALAYRDMMRIRHRGFSGEEPFNFTMMFFASMDADGLIILPTHRLVHGLRDFDAEKFRRDLWQHFTVQTVPDVTTLEHTLAKEEENSFGVVEPTQLSVIRLKVGTDRTELMGSEIPFEVRELDVTLLHTYLFEGLLGISRQAQEQKQNLDYVKTTGEVVHAVASGKAQLGVVMNPTRVDQVQRVSRAGQTMPQKSTFFYPKIISGLVMNPLE